MTEQTKKAFDYFMLNFINREYSKNKASNYKKFFTEYQSEQEAHGLVSEEFLKGLLENRYVIKDFSTRERQFYKLDHSKRLEFFDNDNWEIGEEFYFFVELHPNRTVAIEKKQSTPKKVIDSSKEAILKRAEAVIKATKQWNKDSVIKVFDSISAPFNEGFGLKEDIILKVFELAGIEAKYEVGMGILVPARKDTQISVVSHIDLMPTFNKGFAAGKSYKIGTILDKKGNSVETLTGALDNTLTNAVAIMNALTNTNPNVEFIFTEGEETNFCGIKSYTRNRHDKQIFYINMDVTHEAWNNHISVEFDKPNWYICRQIKDTFNAGFTDDRECDDLDIIMEHTKKGFSYCVPTKKNIHSWANFTKTENLEPYLNGLKWLLNEADLNYTGHDIKHGSIDSALKFNSFEKFEKNQLKRKAKKKSKPSKIDKLKANQYRRMQEAMEMDELTQINGRDGSTYFDTAEGAIEEDFFLTPPDMEPSPFDSETVDYYEANHITTRDIINLENVSTACISALEGQRDSLVNAIYDNLDERQKTEWSKDKVNKSLTNIISELTKDFINEHVFAQDTWTIDQFTEHTGAKDLSNQILLILDEALLLQTITPGVEFKFAATTDLLE